jgi:hypothetical protein
MAEKIAYYDLIFRGIKEIVEQASETQAKKLEAVAEKCMGIRPRFDRAKTCTPARRNMF